MPANVNCKEVMNRRHEWSCESLDQMDVKISVRHYIMYCDLKRQW